MSRGIWSAASQLVHTSTGNNRKGHDFAADFICENNIVEQLFLQVLFCDKTAFHVHAMSTDTSRRANGNSHTPLLKNSPTAFKATECCDILLLRPCSCAQAHQDIR